MKSSYSKVNKNKVECSKSNENKIDEIKEK